jgi:GNAT superfamily N-acetyltransferase
MTANLTFFPFTGLEHKLNPRLLTLIDAYFRELGFGDIEPWPPYAENVVFDDIAGHLHLPHFQWLLAQVKDTICGFCVFQIDSPEKDWNQRPGWGFIREMYIDPDYRGHGLARAMVEAAEQAMRGWGATRIYLTTETPGFWAACGFSAEGATEKNNLPVYIKNL